MSELEKLKAKKEEYVERLDIGAAKIEEARAKGNDVSTWENYWIQLMNLYGSVCDKIRDLEKLEQAELDATTR